jgi:hypothetical protein
MKSRWAVGSVDHETKEIEVGSVEHKEIKGMRSRKPTATTLRPTTSLHFAFIASVDNAKLDICFHP